MTTCQACHSENRAGRKFCGQCGAALAARCEACGFDNDPDDRFCGGCGAALESATSGPEQTAHGLLATDQSRPGQPASATTASGVTGGPEKRQLTVMFCDLAGSTEMAARMDAEDLSALNRLYQETCTAVIREHDGYVARYMGDGILCYFGYPRAHENDGELAIRAALAIQRTIDDHNASVDGDPLQVRIGIATGEVIVGEIVGDGASRESTAVGQTPNLAARLEGLARPGTVLVSDTTRSLAGDLFEFRDLGRHALKGIPEPVPVWEAIGASEQATRFQARSGRRLTALVGRRLECQLIRDCHQEAVAGSGQVVLLCGEPGIGKSRLATEAMTLGCSHSVTLQCAPHRENSTLFPVTEYLRGARKRERDLGRAWPGDFLAERRVDEAHAAALLELLLDGQTERPLPAGNPQLRKQQTLGLVRSILLATADEQPVILVVEDLHWIDPTTLELVNQLVHSVRERRALVLLTFRPVFAQDWVGQSHIHMLNLNRINRRQCQEMVSALMGDDADQGVVAQIVDRTDGIPLYIEEIIQGLSGSSASSLASIPATLADSLNARLDDLGPVRRTAQAASVIGREFGLPLLQAVARRQPAQIEADLHTLVNSGLVYETGDGEIQRFQFKHALIQDAAYNSLVRDRRSRFHGRAARFLLDTPGAREHQAGIIARHLVEAGECREALAYAVLAGEHALASMGVSESLDHFSKAREIAETVADDDTTSADRIRIHTGFAACHRYRENYRKALEHLDMAEQIADPAGDIRALSDICTTRANIFFPMGELDGILREHQRALEFARALGSTELEVRSIGGLGDAYYARGEMDKATAQFQLCCRLSREHGFEQLEAAHYGMIGWSRVYMLDFPNALQDGLEAVRLTREHGHLRGEMNAQALLGFVYAELNQRENGLRHAGIACELGEKIGSWNFRAAIQVFGNRSLDARADREAMLATATEAIETSRRYDAGFHGAAILGELMLVTDDADKRAAIVREAEESLDQGAIAHNCFMFYQNALQTALNHREWDNLEVFRQSMAQRDGEPLTPWSRFYIDRSRVLEDVYRERAGSETRQLLSSLLTTCDEFQLNKSGVELRAAAATLGLDTAVDRAG